MTRCTRAALGALLVVLSLVVGAGPPSGVAAAEPAVGTVTLVRGASPNELTTGPDGALWFTNDESDAIGRVTTGGAYTLFPDARIGAATSIVTGPDGALWFTNQSTESSIGRLDTAGHFSFFPVPDGAPSRIVAAGGALWFTFASGEGLGRVGTDGAVSTVEGVPRATSLTEGPDGAVWVTSNLEGLVRRVAPDGPVTTFADPALAGALGIVTGADGALWVTTTSHPILKFGVVRLTTVGVATDFEAPGVPFADPIAGPDGRLWVGFDFGIRFDTSPVVARLDGTISTSKGPSSRWTDLAVGPDGAMWYTDNIDAQVGSFDKAGATTYLPGPYLREPSGLAVAPDGSAWFAELNPRPHPYQPLGHIDSEGTLTTVYPSGMGATLELDVATDGSVWGTAYGQAGFDRVTPAGDVQRVATEIEDSLRNEHLAPSPDGTMWFVSGSTVGHLSADGQVLLRVAADTADSDAAVDRDGALWFMAHTPCASLPSARCLSVDRLTATGELTRRPVDIPYQETHDLVVGADGAAWWATDGLPGASAQVVRTTVGGESTSFAVGSVDHLAAGGDGAIWFTLKPPFSSIGRLAPDGAVTVVADAQTRPFRQGGPESRTLAAGADGALWYVAQEQAIGRLQVVASPTTTTTTTAPTTTTTAVPTTTALPATPAQPVLATPAFTG